MACLRNCGPSKHNVATEPITRRRDFRLGQSLFMDMFFTSLIFLIALCV
jgi:hypothetical protein